MAIGSEARSTFLAIVKGDASQAVSEFKKLGTNVQKETATAQGSVGKFKSFAGKAMEDLKANAGMYAAGAGAAIGAFAVKAAADFAHLGVEVGKFSDATGLATEDASRWIEVAGDVGIGADVLEKSIGKLSKSIDPKLFKELGVQIAYTKDGATDINGTFLNTIDRLNKIKDPAERARVAAKLLGRGWQDMAELIGQGSGKLRESLAGVSDAKVFSKESVNQSREFRRVMDDLNDRFEDLSLTVGKAVLPALTKTADQVQAMAPIVLDLVDAYGKLTDVLSWTPADPIGFFQNLTGEHKLLGAAVKEGAIFHRESRDAIWDEGDAAKEAAQKTYLLEQQMGDAAYEAAQMRDRVSEAKQKIADLQDQITGSRALVDLRVALRDNADQIAEVKENYDSGKISAQEYYDQTAQLTLESMGLVTEYATSIGNIPAEAVTTLVANLDPSNPEQIFGTLQDWFNNRKLFVTVDGMIADSALRNALEGRTPSGGSVKVSKQGDVGHEKKAGGGLVNAGQPYVVGEHRPELFVPSVPGRIYPNAGGGGGGVTVVVNAPVGANLMEAGRQVADALRTFYQGGGQRVA